MDYILKTHDLTKRFNTTLAVDRVNMLIERGDIYGCIGENGAGKSTIIRLITGLANPTSGSFTLFKANRLGAIAAVVDSPGLHLSLSAENNLFYQCQMLGLKKYKEKVQDILRLIGLEYLIGEKKPVKNFSLGMKQRLGIAMALISDPEFIILDEPMNGLDPIGIIQMRELIKKLNQEQGISFFISSHILSELDKVATKYGFISHGRLIKEVSAKELHDDSSGSTRITFVNPINETIKIILFDYEYEIVNERSIKLTGHVDTGKLLKAFINADIMVSNVENISKGIEDYYLEIIGGNYNA